MKKELLIVDNIRNDLVSAFEYKGGRINEKRMAFIIPFVLLAITAGFIFKNPWIVIAILTVPVYHTVRLVLEKREEKAKKQSMIN